jgi:hypothetical protein
MACQADSTVFPTGDKMPIPVTTTRRLVTQPPNLFQKKSRSIGIETAFLEQSK